MNSKQIDSFKETFEYYQKNNFFKHFQKQNNETNQEAFERAEYLYKQMKENEKHLNVVISFHDNFLEFFEECMKTKERIENEKNKMIDNLIQLKKSISNEDEWKEYKKELDLERDETEDEKERREREEMKENENEIKMNEIKSEKENLNEKNEEMKEEINKMIEREIENLNEENEEMMKILKEEQDDFIKEKEEINQFIENEQNEKQKHSNENETDSEDCVKKKDKVWGDKEEKYGINIVQKKQLEEWTGLECGDVIFDSEIDNWKVNESVFDDKIIGRKQLVIIIEDDHNEKFGYYLNTEIKNEYNKWISTDNKSFEFNIESNGRLNEMMKFPIKDIKYGCNLYDKWNERLIILGNIILYKENNKNKSLCLQREDKYDYQGIPNTLCGKAKNKDENGEFKTEYFTPFRIVVIQMEMSEEQKRKEKEKEEQQIQQLEEWTGLKYGETIFDSEIDNWKENESVFDDKIKGRQRLLFIIEDDHNEKFGYYLNTQVNE